jgi:hypothetical protein
MRKITIDEPLELRGDDKTVGTGFSIGIAVLRKIKNLLETFQNMGSHHVGWCNGG